MAGLMTMLAWHAMPECMHARREDRVSAARPAGEFNAMACVCPDSRRQCVCPPERAMAAWPGFPAPAGRIPPLRIGAPMIRPASKARAWILALPLLLSACWWDGDGNSAGAAAYQLGGTIGGLSTAGLVLANGTDTTSPAAGAADSSGPGCRIA